jgi:hypothetical protein
VRFDYARRPPSVTSRTKKSKSYRRRTQSVRRGCRRGGWWQTWYWRAPLTLRRPPVTCFASPSGRRAAAPCSWLRMQPAALRYPWGASTARGRSLRPELSCRAGPRAALSELNRDGIRRTQNPNPYRWRTQLDDAIWKKERKRKKSVGGPGALARGRARLASTDARRHASSPRPSSSTPRGARRGPAPHPEAVRRRISQHLLATEPAAACSPPPPLVGPCCRRSQVWRKEKKR